MATLIISMILFAIYWLIILAVALHSGSPEYEGDGYGGSILVSSPPVFSRKRKICIKSLWACAVGISICFWQPIMSIVPIIGKGADMVFTYGFVGCLNSGCFFFIFIPAWAFLWFWGVCLLFIYLPAKIIQYVGIVLSPDPF